MPVTYGYARVSKTDDVTRNLETQRHILQEFEVREAHIFADEMTGSSLSRPARNELMTQVRPSGTIQRAHFRNYPSHSHQTKTQTQTENHQKNIENRTPGESTPKTGGNGRGEQESQYTKDHTNVRRAEGIRTGQKPNTRTKAVPAADPQGANTNCQGNGQVQGLLQSGDSRPDQM